MTLEVANVVISEAATAAEVERAFAGVEPSDNWFLNLSAGDDSMECRIQGPRFLLEVTEKDTVRKTTGSVDAATAQAALLAYLAGDQGWRTRVSWAEPVRETGKGPTVPRVLVAGCVVAAAVAVVGLFWLSHQTALLHALPAPLDDPSFWPVGLIWLAIPGSILFVVVKKTIDVKRAAHWTATPARVIRSSIVAKHAGLAGDVRQVTNVPLVEYEFLTVDGHHVTGSRISLGEDAAANAAATLAKYPAGASVTAYYNPSKPGECVLERDPPANMTVVLVVVVLVLFVGVPAALWGIRSVFRALEVALPDGHPAFVMFFTAGALIVFLVTLANRLLARRASAWPVVAGRIATSGVEAYQTSANIQPGTLFRPVVEYAYTVQGREFRSRRIDFGAVVGSSQAIAARTAAAYPVGLQVQVHCDPENPSEAVLQTSAGSTRVFLAFVIIFLALAYLFTGLRRPW